MTTDQEDDAVISRWSKRKRGIELEQKEALSAEEQKEVDEAYEVELVENRQAAEEIDLDTIDEESDLSIFMKAGVPEALKKQALAVLWRSNPVFANIDGLNDYDEDFGSSDLIMKTFKSAYQAGRGYLQKEPDPEEAVLTAEDEDEDEAELQEADTEDQVVEEEPAVGEVVISEPTDAEEETFEVVTPKVSLRKRLMQEG